VLIAVAENAHSSDCQRQIPHWAYAVTWILGPVSVIAVVVGVAIYSYRTERLFVERSFSG